MNVTRAFPVEHLTGATFRNTARTSGEVRTFLGGRLAHPEGQNEEENKYSLKNWSKFDEKMRKVELLSTRDCDAGYGPGQNNMQHELY